MTDSYADSTRVRPIIVALASFIPFVGAGATAVDELIKEHVVRERRARLETLIEELEKGLADFGGPIPLQQSDATLHAAYVTIEATLRTHRRQKIRAFARLLLSGFGSTPLISIEDEHEDFLKILDDLSSREMGILAILEEHESNAPQPDDRNEYAWVGQYWEEFQSQVCLNLNIPPDELSNLLARLTRTGLYERLMGSYFGVDASERGKLTGTYKRLSSIIRVDSNYFDSGTLV